MPRWEIMIAYITCADLDEARRIGRALVEEGLAACVNLRAHETIYRWQGAIEQGPEAALLAKTTRDAYPALQARVRACIPTRCPASSPGRSMKVCPATSTGSAPR